MNKKCMVEEIYEKYGELISIPANDQLKQEFRSYNLVCGQWSSMGMRINNRTASMHG